MMKHMSSLLSTGIDVERTAKYIFSAAGCLICFACIFSAALLALLIYLVLKCAP